MNMSEFAATPPGYVSSLASVSSSVCSTDSSTSVSSPESESSSHQDAYEV